MRNRNSAVRRIAQTGGITFVACLVGALGGCSFAVPMADSKSSAMWQGDPQDVTGAIPKVPPVLSKAFDAEDTRRASAAMSTALDPQGSGASVNWDNPQSGTKGAFTPVGAAYPLDGKICRAFIADVNAKSSAEKLQGVACREKTAEWMLTEVKPFKKG